MKLHVEKIVNLAIIALIPTAFKPITGCSLELPHPKFLPARIMSPSLTFFEKDGSKSSKR